MGLLFLVGFLVTQSLPILKGMVTIFPIEISLQSLKLTFLMIFLNKIKSQVFLFSKGSLSYMSLTPTLPLILWFLLPLIFKIFALYSALGLSVYISLNLFCCLRLHILSYKLCNICYIVFGVIIFIIANILRTKQLLYYIIN